MLSDAASAETNRFMVPPHGEACPLLECSPVG